MSFNGGFFSPSGGAKNYAYRTCQGAVKVGVKGITLNGRASEKVSFDTMKNLVLNEEILDQDMREVYVTEPFKIHRNPREGLVYTAPVSKIYRLVYTKRRRTRNRDGLLLDTLPFGYKDN